MRKALIGTGLLVAVVAGGWLGVESLASDRLRTVIADSPALQASTVRPLRDLRRIGVAVTGLQLRDPAGQLSLPWMRVSLSPLSPTTARLDLPGQGQVTLRGQTSDLGLTAPLASLRLAPLNRMAPAHLSLSAEAVSLDGAALAQDVAIDLQLVSLGGEAPMAARATYDAVLSLAALHPQVLAQAGLDLGPLPDPIAVKGGLRLWLDRTPSVTGGPPPVVIGWQTSGLMFSAGPVTVRVVGRLTRAEDGRAEGRMALYSRDADAMIAMAAGIGLIPAQMQMLLRAGLTQLSQVAMDADLPGPAFPDPAEGELRLPIVLRDGQLILGGVPVGPAPAFP